MSYILFPQSQNKLAILIPTGEIPIDQVIAKDLPVNTPYSVVDSIENVDSDYFDGYIYENGNAIADIEKCKAIHLDKFRTARIPKFATLDVEFIRAIEQSDVKKQAEITAQKQALRDVTKTPLPNTLPEIKAVWPDILK